ncbi:I-kappaB kinase epsilon [Carabus blaptoides fortunei]
MSFLRGSANYVWCTTSVLGKGATGAVFQGVNKNNGEPVAVKTFNQLSHMRPQDVQMREFEVLKKVKHENIVKLLAIEEEQEGRGKVIVMELCTGGSLFNILDDPENMYGLQEQEFLLVLEHLTAGMKHLRDNNLVHRDLKPGNIMKFICDDGTTVYKLTDFGAARELQEDQQFMSLYGTEEYLHPDMYERAVLRKPVGKTFGATVDLWSIGVTLYHVATGNLPFRPFGGRRNKETMFYITTKKASGVIAGTQTSENGAIEWNRDLPTNCQLSAGLKKIVTPLLGGLLEVDTQKIWSFDRFFTEVTKTLSRIAVHVFHVNKASRIEIFIHPDETYEQLQGYITEQTEIPAENQILIKKDTLFLNIVEESMPARGYPVTKPDEPLLLFSKENNNIALNTEPDIPKFPVFPNLVSVENDATQAKQACSVGHVCKRRVEKLSYCSKLIQECVYYFIKLVCNDLAKLHTKSQHISDITCRVKDFTEFFCKNQQFTETLLKKLNHDIKFTNNDWSARIALINKELFQTASAIQQLHQRNVVEDTLKLEWDAVAKGIKCPAQSRAPARGKTLVDRLRDSWQHLLRDRATRSLTYNDEQFHVLERIKIAETGRRLKILLDNECTPIIAQLAENLGDWYKISQTVYLQTMILNKDLDVCEQKLKQFSEEIAIESRIYTEELALNVEEVEQKTKTPLNSSNEQNRAGAKVFKKHFKNIGLVIDDIGEIVKENSEVVELYSEFLHKMYNKENCDM